MRGTGRGRGSVAAVTGAVLVAGLAAFTPSPADAAEPSSLLALYDFSEASGAVVHDASTHGNDATVFGGEAWHSGYMQFTGANHVQMPNDLLAGRSAATIVIETSPQALTGAKFLWNFGGTSSPTSGQGQLFIQPVAPRVAITKRGGCGRPSLPRPFNRSSRLRQAFSCALASVFASSAGGTSSPRA